MKARFSKLFLTAQAMLAGLKQEDGQDLIEYALVVALVAFAATAGMTKLAGGINNAFTGIATTLGSYLS